MDILNLILVSIVLVLIAVGAMSVKLLFVKDGKFSGGSCNHSPELEDKGITCGCGREKVCDPGEPAK